MIDIGIGDQITLIFEIGLVLAVFPARLFHLNTLLLLASVGNLVVVGVVPSVAERKLQVLTVLRVPLSVRVTDRSIWLIAPLTKI